MADLAFHDAALTGLVTVVGGRELAFDDEAETLGLSEQEVARLKRSVGLNTRHVVREPHTTTGDLCCAAASKLLAGMGLDAVEIDGIVLVTQTPDYASPSTAISLQHRLGMRVDTACFDVRLGCSGFVYGLSVAYSFVQSGLRRMLVCVGDVASRMVPPDDRAITPLMGDAGAAALVERQPSESVFQLYSDGSGARALYIPNSGLRVDSEDEGFAPLMRMDGSQVFNFTLQRVPPLLNDILQHGELTSDEVDYFVLHQPNKYILSNMQRRLQLPEEKLPIATQSRFGNQNSASIPGTINGFLSKEYSTRPLTSVFAGFGVGLSWGACVVRTGPIWCPPTHLYEDNAP